MDHKRVYSVFTVRVLPSRGPKLVLLCSLRTNEPTNIWKVLQHLEARLQEVLLLLKAIPPHSNTVTVTKEITQSDLFIQQIRLHQPLQILLDFEQPLPAHVRGECAEELLQNLQHKGV